MASLKLRSCKFQQVATSNTLLSMYSICLLSIKIISNKENTQHISRTTDIENKMSHSFVQSHRQLLSFNYNKNQSFHANQVEMIEPLKINGFADTRDELLNAITAR